MEKKENPINTNPDKGHVNLSIEDFLTKFSYLEDEIGEQITDELKTVQDGRDI
jgi:hypothetical protein